ncbi:unnamed protein product [Angiostrongylus costaricensis]|uniref:ATE_N domain-containing protein n=1 Tax=Angiostrongylus costaricensis TaxID=334426 RepID=A0A0R3PGM4_ANGCS|nr:unnamed protein product [Angiostrongylus costaricensis]
MELGAKTMEWSKELFASACFLKRFSYNNYPRCLKQWSGRYIYKPIMDRTCCPQYTIRLDCTKYILSRSQRRILRQMNEYLRSDTKNVRNVREEATACGANLQADRALVKEDASHNDRLPKKKDKSGNPVRKKKEMRRERCFARWRDKGLNEEEMKKARVAKVGTNLCCATVHFSFLISHRLSPVESPA